MSYVMFDYQLKDRRKIWNALVIIIALTGIPLAFINQSIFPLFSSPIIAILIYVGLWYGQDYRVPRRVGVGEHGIDLFHVNGKEISIPWTQLNSYGLSWSPETTVAPAIIFYSGRKFNYVSYEAAKEIARRYEFITNRPLREVWLAKDLKNRFRNL